MTSLKSLEVQQTSAILVVDPLFFQCKINTVVCLKELQPWLWLFNSILVAWENTKKSWLFAAPPLVSPPNATWKMSVEIPYWRCVTTQAWVVFLIGWSKFPLWHNQSEALPRSGERHVISNGISPVIPQISFRGKPLVVVQNFLALFWGFTMASCIQFIKAFVISKSQYMFPRLDEKDTFLKNLNNIQLCVNVNFPCVKILECSE